MDTKQDIIDYLISESDGEYTQEELEKMTPYGLIDTYLNWVGIIGYTSDIINVVKASGISEQG